MLLWQEIALNGLTNRKWFVQPNDLVGGWCVMPVNLPPSSGAVALLDTFTEDLAAYVVHLHNASWEEKRRTS